MQNTTLDYLNNSCWTFEKVLRLNLASKTREEV